MKTKVYIAEFLDNAGSSVELRAESVSELYAENKSILPAENDVSVYCYEYLIVDGRPHLKSKKLAGTVSGMGFFLHA